MRKIYLTIIAASLAISGAMAQGIQVGPKVGLNMAKFSDGEETPEGVSEPFSTGLNIGGAFSIPVNEMFSVAPEISFSQKGAKLFLDEEDDDFGKMILNYIDVPVLVRASFGEQIRGYVNVGPAFNYLLGGKYKFEEDGETGSAKIVFADAETEIADDEFPLAKEWVNRFEVAVAIGGGIMLDTEGGSFLVDLRYNAGLTNIGDFGEEDGKLKNNVLSLSVIYLLGSK